MGEIVNLRRARKDRDRQEREKTASDNRIKHGLSKPEKLLAAKSSELATKKLDGHRLEKDDA